jgi:hypothetical protein
MQGYDQDSDGKFLTRRQPKSAARGSGPLFVVPGLEPPIATSGDTTMTGQPPDREPAGCTPLQSSQPAAITAR